MTQDDGMRYFALRSLPGSVCSVCACVCAGVGALAGTWVPVVRPPRHPLGTPSLRVCRLVLGSGTRELTVDTGSPSLRQHRTGRTERPAAPQPERVGEPEKSGGQRPGPEPEAETAAETADGSAHATASRWGARYRSINALTDGDVSSWHVGASRLLGCGGRCWGDPGGSDSPVFRSTWPPPAENC
uniref:Uncharacterized protein n=1 Tax=Sphaerodactylus townsendi TaxID=933632 RepID=A0ACB8F9G0_9SAUR